MWTDQEAAAFEDDAPAELDAEPDDAEPDDEESEEELDEDDESEDELDEELSDFAESDEDPDPLLTEPERESVR